MEENIKEVKDKILEFADDENFSEAVKTFWAWKEKNPKITDSQSADLHILAAKSFVRYCKQNDSWDEMNKLFGGQKSSEKTPENHSAAAEVKNSKQKNESEEEKFIKSLELIDCGENRFVSQRAFSEQDIKKLFIDWGIASTDSSLKKGSLANSFIDEINTKFNKKFSIPTESALRDFYHQDIPQNGNPEFLDLCLYENSYSQIKLGFYDHTAFPFEYARKPLQLRLMFDLQNDF